MTPSFMNLFWAGIHDSNNTRLAHFTSQRIEGKVSAANCTSRVTYRISNYFGGGIATHRQAGSEPLVNLPDTRPLILASRQFRLDRHDIFICTICSGNPARISSPGTLR